MQTMQKTRTMQTTAQTAQTAQAPIAQTAQAPTAQTAQAPATPAMLRILKTRLLTKLTASTQIVTQNSNGNRSSTE